MLELGLFLASIVSAGIIFMVLKDSDEQSRKERMQHYIEEAKRQERAAERESERLQAAHDYSTERNIEREAERLFREWRHETELNGKMFFIPLINPANVQHWTCGAPSKFDDINIVDEIHKRLDAKIEEFKAKSGGVS